MSLAELREFGLEEMDAGETEEFLAGQSVGILGLPAENEPYLLPLSYAFDELPASQWGEIGDLLGNAWRPEVFRTASTSRNVAIYEFELLESTGIKHTGLAPARDDE